jgi:hypothetical protein
LVKLIKTRDRRREVTPSVKCMGPNPERNRFHTEAIAALGI